MRSNRRSGRRLAPLRITAAALLLAAALPAPAQGGGTWYTVELIVFEQLDDTGLYEESWPLDPGRPAIEDALALRAPGGEPREAFQRVAGEALSLRETWSRLRRSRGYRPLLHVAWNQPGFSRGRARAARITTGAPGDASGAEAGGLRVVSEKVDGTVRLYRARYLHLEADLLYRRPRAAGSAGATALSPTTFRMTERRRMRSRELHYIDHPLFGVIVLVTPLAAEEPSAEPPEEPTTTPLPAPSSG